MSIKSMIQIFHHEWEHPFHDFSMQKCKHTTYVRLRNPAGIFRFSYDKAFSQDFIQHLPLKNFKSFTSCYLKSKNLSTNKK